MQYVLRFAPLLALALCSLGAAAQRPREFRLRIDNDGLNLWRDPAHRPDEEYTSGVHVTVEGGQTPWWFRTVHSLFPTCRVGVRACRTQIVELGQDIYTPRRTTHDSIAPPGSRMDAGWLYLTQGARVLYKNRADDFGLTLGVTGEPSLADRTQTVAHNFARGFARPIDWKNQMPFTVAFLVEAAESRRLALRAWLFSIEVLPRAAVDAGTLRVSAETGVHVRAGINMSHPWLPSSPSGAELAFSGGVTGRAVWHDMFLDGRPFHDDRSVGHEPYVRTYDALATLRLGPVSLSAATAKESRTYPTGPAFHAWSSVMLGVRFGFGSQ